MKIALGTAQFGGGYGIANQQGCSTVQELEAILKVAELNEIHVIDTAPSYGQSESVLGGILESGNWKIVTKTAVIEEDNIGSSQIRNIKETFYRSLDHLRTSRVDSLLVHKADNLLKPGGDDLFESLQEFRSRNLVQKIGVSIYTASQIDQLLSIYPIDIVQLPISILDQRLKNSGHLKTLKSKGIEVHARSVLLQGLLTMKVNNLPKYFKPIAGRISKVAEKAVELDKKTVELAISYVTGIAEIDKIVVGVVNPHQLNEIIRAVNDPVEPNAYMDLSLDDEHYLNPSFWN